MARLKVIKGTDGLWYVCKKSVRKKFILFGPKYVKYSPIGQNMPVYGFVPEEFTSKKSAKKRKEQILKKEAAGDKLIRI